MVSVAMATYNGEKFIEEQLLSILNQTRRPDEVIICDDGSTDRTAEIIEKFIKKHDLENWKFSVNIINLGCGNNFIETAKKTSGDIVFFADQDDIWDLKKVEKMINIMEENLGIYVLVCNESYIDKDGNKYATERINGSEKRLLTKCSIFEPKINRMGLLGMCMASRRCILEYLFLLEQRLTNPAHDVSCSFIASVMDGLYIYSEVLAYHRLHENNLSKISIERKPLNRNRNERLVALQYNISVIPVGLENIEDISGNGRDFTKGKVQCKKYISIAKKRLENYQNKKLIKALLMLVYVPKYLHITAYISDIIYILSLEKYFNKYSHKIGNELI